MSYFVLSGDGTSKNSFKNIVICKTMAVAEREANECKDAHVVIKSDNKTKVIKKA